MLSILAERQFPIGRLHLLASALEGLNEQGVSIISAEGEWVFSNRTHARLLGYDASFTILDESDARQLMKLCRADITSKNNEKVTKFLRNFDLVERKMAEVEEKDHIRNFQPPVSGDEIMKMYNIPPGRVIGEIKEEIKEAILEGRIKNDRDEALGLLRQLALAKGLRT